MLRLPRQKAEAAEESQFDQSGRCGSNCANFNRASSYNDKAFYYLVLIFFAISVAIMAALLRSPFGRTLQAICENERRTRFLGVLVDRHIWLSWVVSCVFVSLAGALYGLLNNFADPHNLRWDQSGDFVIMAVLGGMRSFWGPLIGAAIFVLLQDYISSQTDNWMSFIGLFFVLVVLFFPRGVLGLVPVEGRHHEFAGSRRHIPSFWKPCCCERRLHESRRW